VQELGMLNQPADALPAPLNAYGAPDMMAAPYA